MRLEKEIKRELEAQLSRFREESDPLLFKRHASEIKLLEWVLGEDRGNINELLYWKRGNNLMKDHGFLK